MRNTSLKLSILALVIVAALAVVPAASAGTLDLMNGSTVLGTVTFTQDGANVDVTVTMNSGFALLINGGDIGIIGGLNVGGTSALSSGAFTATAKNNVKIGGFTFDELFKTNSGGGQNFVTTLAFTISNANASAITGFGFHVCFDFVGGSTGCAPNSTAFFVTGSPAPIPEPGTLGLLGTGLVGLAGLVRRRFVS